MSFEAVDFLRRPRQPRVGWILLMAGAVALGAAVWFEQHWAAERSEALRLHQLSLAARLIKPKPVRPAESTVAERRQQQAQMELRRPWLPALRAVEFATADPVYLLSLSIEPTTGLVKLEAEAPSFAHALAYVAVLDEGGVLNPAALVSHAEAQTPPTDRPLVRFTVATRWNAR